MNLTEEEEDQLDKAFDYLYGDPHTGDDTSNIRFSDGYIQLIQEKYLNE